MNSFERFARDVYLAQIHRLFPQMPQARADSLALRLARLDIEREVRTNTGYLVHPRPAAPRYHWTEESYKARYASLSPGERNETYGVVAAAFVASCADGEQAA